MKILLNAFPLLAPKSGVGYYTYHLLHALRRLYAERDSFVYFYGRRFSTAIAERPPALDAAARRALKSVFDNPYRFTQPVKEFIFRCGAAVVRPDLYHETNYVLMPFRGPRVVTVFDMSVKRFPETHPPARVRFFNAWFDCRLGDADHIITISESAKRDIVEIMGVRPEVVTVTHLAPPPSFARPDEAALAAFRTAKGLEQPFLLYVGNLEPRKNLEMLVRAYAALVHRKPAAPRLVLAGEPSWLSDPLFAEIDRLGLRDRVLLPGYVPEDELPLWYSTALAFLYPSRYEGFGLPVVEAMACGSPVLCANASSLPEVAGDAAVLLPPDDEEAWTNGMDEIEESVERRVLLRDKGMRRAALFSWDRCAKETHAVYERVVHSS
ncbi:glycosyltransferase family 4 protein [bacterium]|nr:glycosyltransferase family 4 protein [bacterium]